MTIATAPRPPVPPRAQFLIETVVAELALLQGTDARLFGQPMTRERAASLRTDDLLAECVDAFVARFGRLRDTLADKPLPAALDWLAEPTGSATDNLARAERLGWITSVDDWLAIGRQRNRMIPEYVRDSTELAAALTAAHDAVPMLRRAVDTLSALARRS